MLHIVLQLQVTLKVQLGKYLVTLTHYFNPNNNYDYLGMIFKSCK